MAEDNSGKSEKRSFKNPETFRERAIKVTEEKAKPAKSNSKLKSPFRAIKAIFRPLGRAYSNLKKVEALKPVFTVLRVIGKIIFPSYFRTSYQELKKVSWPSFKESRKLTYAVLVFAIIFGASVAIVDWGLGKVFKHLLLK